MSVLVRHPPAIRAKHASPCGEATHSLDLDRARRLLRATRHLRLRTEQEMKATFPQFEIGALPPLGPLLPKPEAFDIRLL